MKPLIEIGQFGKTHGIAGEINAMIDFPELDLAELRCIFMDVDGLRVPFFIESVRPKGTEIKLVKIEGYDSQDKVRQFVNKTIYAEADEPAISALDTDTSDDPESDGLYASDLIGYRAVTPEGSLLGEITDFDDNTANVLLIITRPDKSNLFVPVADEIIAAIDTDTRTITLDLPDGLINLNK